MKNTTEAFDRINARCAARFGVVCTLHHCVIAERDHRERERWFAHTNHHNRCVCVCSALDLLPEKYLYGILAHEFGHVLAFEYLEDCTEDTANYVSAVFLDLPIEYTGRLQLQEVTKKAIKGLI